MIYTSILERFSVELMLKKIYSVIFVTILIIVLSSCKRVYSDIDKYENYINSIPGAQDFMPSLDQLLTYERHAVFYVETSSKSLNLIVYYSPDEYQDAKDIFLNSYEFLEEPLMEYNYYTIPEVEIFYNGYVIKVVKDENFNYPEQFGMFGYSDINHSISFMFFYDRSLNRLESYSLSDLIKYDFVFPKN
jgi:hypothetical protein